MLSQASAAFDMFGSRRSPESEQREDFARRLAPEGRIGVEEEVFPAEEALADLDLVGVDLGAAGKAEIDA